jgi:hypothetical protein
MKWFRSKYTQFLESEHERLLEEIKDLKAAIVHEREGFRRHINKLTERLLERHGVQLTPTDNKAEMASMLSMFDEESRDELEDNRKALDEFAN